MTFNEVSAVGNIVTDFTTESSTPERNIISNLRSQLNSMMIRLEKENDRLNSLLSKCQCSKLNGRSSLAQLHILAERSNSNTLRGTSLSTAHVEYPEHFTSSSAYYKGICQSIEQDSELPMNESSSNTSYSTNLCEVSIKEGKHISKPQKYSNCCKLKDAKQPDHHIIRHDYCKRHIALKIMYFGQRFYGFASEAQMEPTVESELFKALERTKLLVGTRKNSHYSRCGRTDKGVSSTGQVISLYLRSNGKDIAEEKEINYAMVLNRVLPKDIRVIGSAPVLSEFNARFSCLSREYRYLFWKETMDTSVMQKAAKKFIGEHDFRNFCKMDAVNVNNYKRRITEFSILPWDKWSNDDNLWAMTIKGSAFLWHQVRCMISVLFMIGDGFESPDIIDVLLNINKTPRKPQYRMASELPLMLHFCEFQDVNFTCSSDALRNLKVHFSNELRSCLLQAAMIEEALNCLQTAGVEESSRENHKKKKGHISLLLRPTEPSYEERRAKLAMKSACSLPASSSCSPPKS